MFKKKTIGLFFTALIMIIVFVLGCADILLGGPAKFSGGSSDKSGGWTEAKYIELVNGNYNNGPIDHNNHEVCMDNEGNAVIVWVENDISKSNKIYAKYYDINTGWDITKQINSTNNDADYPDVEFDQNGNALVVWRQTDNDGNIHIWSNRYRKGIGWEGPVKVENENRAADEPKLFINDSGKAYVIYRKSNGSNFDVCVNFYLPGIGWSDRVQIDKNSSQTYSPDILVDNNGNPIAFWFHENVDDFDLYSCVYDSLNGWGDPEKIVEKCIYYKSIIDDNGNINLIYSQRNIDTNYDLKSRVYVPNTGWYSPISIEDIAGSSRYPDITMSNGNIFVVWEQAGSNHSYDIYNNQYVKNDGWRSIMLLEDETIPCYMPKISSDSQGNIIAVWQLNNDGKNNQIICVSHYKDNKWSKVKKINKIFSYAYDPEIAMSSNGKAIVIWVQKTSYTGEYVLWYSIYK